MHPWRPIPLVPRQVAFVGQPLPVCQPHTIQPPPHKDPTGLLQVSSVQLQFCVGVPCSPSPPWSGVKPHELYPQSQCPLGETSHPPLPGPAAGQIALSLRLPCCGQGLASADQCPPGLRPAPLMMRQIERQARESIVVSPRKKTLASLHSSLTSSCTRTGCGDGLPEVERAGVDRFPGYDALQAVRFERFQAANVINAPNPA